MELSENLKYFNKYLSTGSNILDIGRGTGRDLANLMIQDDSLGKDTQWCVQIWRKGKVSQR